MSFVRLCGDMTFTATDCEKWKAAVLPASLPQAKGNRFAEDPNAAKLGFDLFFDVQALSAPGQNIGCGRCHAPEQDFSDVQSLSLGLILTARNAPALVNVTRNFPHFWDGRADSLWSQPLATIENDAEMAGTRLGVAHFISDNYRAEFELVFGPLPDFSDVARFPPQGKPGVPAWDGMAPADQALVNQVYVDVGKALEAYERKIATGPSAFDRFIQGRGGLSADAQVGMRLFVETGCMGCHSGPYFTDGRYHGLDVPVPQFLAKTANDPGRAAGIPKLLSSEFNSLSPYYDWGPGEQPRLIEDTSTTGFDPNGAFLTPSLRNVAVTGPYLHNGSLVSLTETVRFHLAGGGPRCIDPLLVKHSLADDQVAALVVFLGSLTGDVAPLPWSFWPSVEKPSANPYADSGGLAEGAAMPDVDGAAAADAIAGQ